MATMATFERFELAEHQVNARGAKFCPLSSGGERVHLTFRSKAQPLSTQWGPSSFDQNSTSTRCNFDFVCDDGLASILKSLDVWARAYLEKNSQRLMGKALTSAQILDSYKPAHIERGSYPSQARCKINLGGPRAVRCWDENGQPRDPPSDWKSCRFVAKVNLSHLYIMSKEFGWVLNITDLHMFEESHVCPFVCGSNFKHLPVDVRAHNLRVDVRCS